MNWRWIGSGFGLLVSAIFAVVMTGAQGYAYEDRLPCSMLLAAFGYLFLSRETPKEAAEAPWWW